MAKKILPIVLFFLLIGANQSMAETPVNKENPFMYYVENIAVGDVIEYHYRAGGNFNGARMIMSINEFQIHGDRSATSGLQTNRYEASSNYGQAIIRLDPFSSHTHQLLWITINGEELDIYSPKQPPDDFPYPTGLLYGSPATFFNGEVYSSINSTTDKNVFTGQFIAMGSYVEYNIEPSMIHSYYFLGSSGTFNKITFFDSSSRVVEELTPQNKMLLSLASPIENVSRIRIERLTSNSGLSLYGFEVYGGDMGDVEPPISLNVTDVTDRSISIAWQNSNDPDLQRVALSINGQFHEEFQRGVETYKIEGLSPDTEYTLALTSINRFGVQSEPITTTAKTEESILEVSNLQADTEHNRVNLSWTNPNNTSFKLVRIYRSTSDQSFFDRLFSMSASANGYEPIFETNGTYFNDLTVAPATTYSYLLTTEQEDGTETEGVSITATTDGEPKPVMDGIELERDNNGDYIYRWTEPTRGQVIVLVGGEEYARVPASNRAIRIPMADMKHNIFGSPDVRLIPVGEYGSIGDTTNPNNPNGGGGGANVGMPFEPKDVLGTGVNILGFLAPLLLLWLAVWFTTYKLLPFIKKVVATSRERRSL